MHLPAPLVPGPLQVAGEGAIVRYLLNASEYPSNRVRASDMLVQEGAVGGRPGSVGAKPPRRPRRKGVMGRMDTDER